MPEPTRFDVIVVGAGPAGSLAARYAASGGASVALLERKAKVGAPVRCGEGVGLRGLSRTVTPDPRWILNTVTKVRFVSPGGTVVNLDGVGENFVVDRTIMDADLVRQASDAGARYFAGVQVLEVARLGGGVYGCRTSGPRLEGRCVILADGVESKLARSLGWSTHLRLEDINSCAFCKVRSSAIEQDVCVFHTGRSVAPGGYAWVFPRGDGSANVGLGLLGTMCGPGRARQALADFVQRQFPGSPVTDTHCGGVPVGKWLRPLVREGVMVVGDAARQVHALTGGGISYGLIAGRLAGTTAAEAGRGGVLDQRHLIRYEREWRRTFGRDQNRSFALKSVALSFTDGYLDGIARSLARARSSKLSYARVFAIAFARNPLLLVKAVRLFR